jgi:lipopolysaccharide-induced tumor necrosis factor-alpha factor
MQKDEQQPQAAPAAADIEAAPPAYAPRGADEPTDPSQQPAPVKDMPTDLNAHQPHSTAPMAAQQAVPGVIPINQLGDRPQWIDCPFCNQRTMTRVATEGTSMQIVAGVLCCLLCVCLACVPCMAHWFEETNYFCSKCHNKVATRPESGMIIVHAPVTVVPSKHAA